MPFHTVKKFQISLFWQCDKLLSGLGGVGNFFRMMLVPSEKGGLYRCIFFKWPPDGAVRHLHFPTVWNDIRMTLKWQQKRPLMFRQWPLDGAVFGFLTVWNGIERRPKWQQKLNNFSVIKKNHFWSIKVLWLFHLTMDWRFTSKRCQRMFILPVILQFHVQPVKIH